MCTSRRVRPGCRTGLPPAEFGRHSGGWTLHQLRHSSLTHLAEAGASAVMLQAKSRHRDLRTLLVYARAGRRSTCPGSPLSSSILRWVDGQMRPSVKRTPWAGPGGEPGQGLVGVFGVGDGFFGHETVEHLPQGDRCVVGPDDGGGPLDDRRPGDPSFYGAGCCVGWAAGPVVGVG